MRKIRITQYFLAIFGLALIGLAIGIGEFVGVFFGGAALQGVYNERLELFGVIGVGMLSLFIAILLFLVD